MICGYRLPETCEAAKYEIIQKLAPHKVIASCKPKEEEV